MYIYKYIYTYIYIYTYMGTHSFASHRIAPQPNRIRVLVFRDPQPWKSLITQRLPCYV